MNRRSALNGILMGLLAAAPAALWAALESRAAPPAPESLPGLELSVAVPSGWLLDDSDARTLHLAQLYGPWLPNVDHAVISLFYYGPGSAFSSKESYARKRLAPRAGSWEERRTVTRGKMLVHGEAAPTYTSEFVDTYGLYGDLHREPAREDVVLLDAPRGGFYVFRYRAAKAIYDDYLSAFRSLLASAGPAR